MVFKTGLIRYLQTWVKSLTFITLQFMEYYCHIIVSSELILRENKHSFDFKSWAMQNRFCWLHQGHVINIIFVHLNIVLGQNQ